MSKRQSLAQTDVALSPYLSLRQALRPAIFAHSLLLRERAQVRSLADEANLILAATHELMSKAGLGYVAVPDPRAPQGVSGGVGNQTSILDAFADAAILWTKVVGGLLALAESLFEQGCFDEVRTLAAVLDDAGEAG